MKYSEEEIKDEQKLLVEMANLHGRQEAAEALIRELEIEITETKDNLDFLQRKLLPREDIIL